MLKFWGKKISQESTLTKGLSAVHFIRKPCILDQHIETPVVLLYKRGEWRNGLGVSNIQLVIQYLGSTRKHLVHNFNVSYCTVRQWTQYRPRKVLAILMKLCLLYNMKKWVKIRKEPILIRWNLLTFPISLLQEVCIDSMQQSIFNTKKANFNLLVFA